jgi:hypothetical protein
MSAEAGHLDTRSTWKVAISNQNFPGAVDFLTIKALHVLESSGGALVFHDNKESGIALWPEGRYIVAIFPKDEWICVRRVEP